MSVVEFRTAQGDVALIDADDAHLLGTYRWRTLTNVSGNRYVMRNTTGAGRRRRAIYLHRLIAGAAPGMQVDHVNDNGLDNRKANLRVATQQQNLSRCRQKVSASGYRGVYFRPDTLRKWTSQLKVGGRIVQVGRFDDPKDAARAYDAAAIKYFGAFARTNASLGLLEVASAV